MTRSGISLLGKSSLGSGWKEGQGWLWGHPAAPLYPDTPLGPSSPGTTARCSPLQPQRGRHLPQGAFLDSWRLGPEPFCPHHRLDAPRHGPGPTGTWQTGPGQPHSPGPPHPPSASRDLEQVGLLTLVPTQRQAPRGGLHAVGPALRQGRWLLGPSPGGSGMPASSAELSPPAACPQHMPHGSSDSVTQTNPPLLSLADGPWAQEDTLGNGCGPRRAGAHSALGWRAQHSPTRVSQRRKLRLGKGR